MSVFVVMWNLYLCPCRLMKTLKTWCESYRKKYFQGIFRSSKFIYYSVIIGFRELVLT